MKLRAASLTMRTFPIDAGFHVILIKVAAQVQYGHEVKVDFPFFTDRTGNLINREWHDNPKNHVRGQSRVFNYGPLQSGRIRHRASGTERRCVRGFIFYAMEFFGKFLHKIKVPFVSKS